MHDSFGEDVNTLSSRLLRLAARLFIAGAILEAVVTWVTTAFGHFRIDVGPLRFSSDDPFRSFALTLVFAALVWLNRRSLPPARSWEELSPWARRGAAGAAVLATALALIRPLAAHAFPGSHDLGAHLTYTYLFDQAFRQGQFPVRWVEGIGNGYGQPLFNFYQVGLYYVVDAVHLFVPTLSLALKVALALLWAAGGLFTFMLFRRLGPLSGFLAAFVFVSSPYLLLDFYVRAAYPEFSALMLAPGVLWAIDRYLRAGEWRLLAALPPLLALLIVCHLPSVLIVAPVASMYVAYLLIVEATTFERALALVPAALIGAAMAAFYVMPAVAELRLIQASRLTADTLDYHRHFVDPGQWFRWTWGYVAEEMSFQVGVIQWAAIAATGACALWALRGGRGRTLLGESLWWLLVVLFGLFMTTTRSLPVWEAVKPLAFIQFPWRYMMLVSIGCAGLAALAVAAVSNPHARLSIVVVVLLAQWTVSSGYLREARDHTRDLLGIDDPDWRRSADARAHAVMDSGYDPAGTKAPRHGAELGRWTVVRGEAAVSPRLLHDDRLELDVRTAAGARLAVNSHYMPGWVISMDAAPAPIVLQPASGYLEVDVPPGSHFVDARFRNTPIRSAANAVSAAATAAWLLGSVMVLRNRRRVARGRS